MSIHQIVIKDNLSTPDFRKYIHELEVALCNVQNVKIDLRKAKYVSVFGAMLIEVYKDVFKSKNLKLEVEYKEGIYKTIVDLLLNKQEKQFEKFFKADYLKISRCFNSRDTFNAANLISDILLNKMNCSDDVSTATSWLIAEVADNAGVHGYKCLLRETFPFPVYIVAYENGNSVDICIVDRGLGIVNTLRTHGNKKLKTSKEKLFLSKALEKGVSGHPVSSPGFGLFGTKEIIKKSNGCMEIFSNKYSIKLNKGNILTNTLLSEFNGTFVALRLRKDARIELSGIILESTQEQLREWRDNKEEILWS